MRRWALPVVVAALVLVTCGGAPVATTPSSSAVPAQSASPIPAPSAAPSASASGATTRVEGSVKAAAATALTLADGTTLTLSVATRITRTDPATLADLKSGQFVAITAKPQAGGTLLASLVMIFADSTSRLVPPGQRPLPEGNLMTNASIAAIDQVTSNSFTVTFQSASATVVLAPDAKITHSVDVRPEAIPVGARIVAVLASGVVQSISIQTPP